MTEHPLEQWLRDEREKAASEGRRPLRRREFAAEIGCSPARISQITKHNDAPSLALAAKLSKRTGIPLDKFVRQTEAAE